MGAMKGQASKSNAGLPNQAPAQQGSPAKPDEPIVLDPSRKYVLNPNKPNEIFSADEILNGFNRGNLASQRQSQIDKLNAELEAARNLANNLSSQNEEIKSQLDARKSRETFEQMAKDMGLIPNLQQQEENGYSTFEDQGTVNPRNVVNQLTSLEQNVLSKAEQRAREVAARTNQELNEQRRQAEERQNRTQAFINEDFKGRVNDLKSKLPDIDPMEIDQLARDMIVGTTLLSEARERHAQGQVDEATNLYAEANARSQGAMDKYAELKLKQLQSQYEVERQAQINMFSTGGPEPEGQGYTEPTMNKREAAKRFDERLAKVKAIEKQMDRLGPV